MTKLVLTMALPTLLVSAPAFAQDTPPGLRDLVGARAGQAELELVRRGYESVRSEAGDDRRYIYWWNRTYGRCVAIATMNGRYDSILETPAPDCRVPGSVDRPTTLPQRPGYRPVDRDRPTPLPERPGYGPGDGDDRFAVDGRPVDLGLICFGEGQGPSLTSRGAWTWNPRRDRYDYGSRLEMSQRYFDTAVTLQIWDGGGRIRLPRSLVPPLNSRGSDGWWNLTEVAVGPDRIGARYRLNGLNRPQVSIDRQSGRIRIVGTASYAFRGTCDTIDGRDHRRF